MTMTNSDLIIQTRANMLRDLGHEPAHADVARVVGVTRERVRQVYKANWIDTGEARRQRKERTLKSQHEKRREINHKIFATTKKGLDIAEILANRPDLTTTEIGRMFGVTQTKVSQIGCACGLNRKMLFTAEQDDAILAGKVDPADVGRVGDNARALVYNRRDRLLRTACRRTRGVTPEMWDTLAECTSKGYSVKKCAASLGLGVGHTGTLRQYLPLRLAWSERHPCGRGVCPSA